MSKSEKKSLRPIGVLRTPFRNAADCPRQGSITKFEGEAEILPDYASGLKDVDKFSHVWLIYKFSGSPTVPMVITPRHSRGVPRGLFATRSPHRLNPIGITLVKVLEVQGGRIRFVGADMVDGTELLDIKPYIPDIDCPREKAGSGWLAGHFESAE